ncbi:TonB-dependent receptor plug domain-containing protein [Massilia yuzhufengensis]|uniref:Iron complex outermembrane recepter protein n=1 Tax=Massilia yuzhufengensis TaxID=1164594 RepID=A0A1I1N3Y3_9BURK|nr:TonB-dependent receptor [Massilia yuzhufengensis]SFC92374.1 iron complex outermembrane recepter protein [Massilia yuzhufengensis]
MNRSKRANQHDLSSHSNRGHAPQRMTAVAFAAFCLAAGIPAAAIAQEAPAAELQPVAVAAPVAQLAAPAVQGVSADNQVVITGSRVRGVAPVGSSVISVGRVDIDNSGATSTAGLLQEVPQVMNLGVSESSRTTSGGSGNITYGSSVNLRGIGPYATLTLVNGHRTVSQGTTGASVDPSVIPMLALQRVEVVADGASAIYGSDAVAGVVNLILRRNVKGAEGFVRYGKGDDYSERQAGALFGHEWKGGQFVVTVQHDYNSALSGLDRDFYAGDLRARGGRDFRSNQCRPGNIIIGSTTYAIPQGGVTAANRAALVPGTVNLCDNLKNFDLLPRKERNSAAFTFNQELGNGFQLYADGFGTRREYYLTRALTASNLNVPSTNPFYVRPAGAPAGTSETVAYSFGDQLPSNDASGFSRSFNGTVGIDKTFGSGWKAGVLYTYGVNDDQAATYRGLDNAAVNAALRDTNPATALNVFGGPNNPATLDAISRDVSISPGETTFQNAQLKADGPLFDIAGGTVRAAVGYEHQRIHTEGGQTRGPELTPATGLVQLDRRIDSVYGEVAVPLVGAGNAMPFVHRFDVNAAWRYDRYSDVGSTNNPKLGVNWAPVKGFTVKGSYGTSFRAPGLTQIRGFALNGLGGLYVQNYSDPTIGGALRVGVTRNGPNEGLEPETARTRSLGFEWEPSWRRNTRLGMSYFDVLYENQVTGYLSDLSILNREAQFAGTGIITRNPSPELVAQLISSLQVASGVLPANWTLFVDGRNNNLGKSRTSGIDFQASTRVLTENYGSFGLGLSGTYFTKYEVAITPGAALLDQLNLIYNPIRFKSRLSANWSEGQWYANTYVNYARSYANNLTNPVQRVGSNTTVDARIAYELGERAGSWLQGTTVALNVTNLFDRAPPFVNLAQSNNGGGGFDPTASNPIGRIVSFSLNKRF